MSKKSKYGKVTKVELIDELDRTKEMLRLFHRYATIPNEDYDEGWCNVEARMYPLSLCIKGLKDWEKRQTEPVAPPKRAGRDCSADY